MKNRRASKAANDNRIDLRQALRRWAENRWDVRAGVKAFLMHLANHAEPDATVFVERKHFARVMSVSERSITNYVRRLIDEGLISPTGEVYARPSVRYEIYRVAPGVEHIDAILNREETSDQRSGTSDLRSGKSIAVYKDNCTTNINNTSGSLAGLIAANDLDQIPQDLQARLFEVLGPAKFASYIAHARWRNETRSIHPQNGYAAKWLKENARNLFNMLDLDIGQPIPKVGPRG